MLDQDPYLRFKLSMGWVLLGAAVLYGVLVTILLMFFGTKVASDALVWGFITTIISTMMGWLMAKASTVIDNVWGSSRSSDVKTDYIMKESDDAKKKLLLSGSSIVPAVPVPAAPDGLLHDDIHNPSGSPDASDPAVPVA